MNAIIEKLNSAGSLFVNFSAVMLVQTSILILILLAVDFLLRKKVRAVFRYCIWLLVLVKLIIPPSISSPVSIGNLFGDKLSEIKIDKTETPSQIGQAGQIIKVPALAIPEPKHELYKEIDPAGTHLRSLEWQKEHAKVIEASTGQIEQQQKPVAASMSITWQGTAFLAWAIVLLILILLLIQRAMFVRGLVAQADEITGGLNDLVQSCGRLVGMKGQVRLKTSPNATGPAVCGLFRPVILLPQNLAPSLTKEQLKAVLIHELVHIKRGDLWVNLFQALLQIAYFYNPLIWLANAIIRRVREQAVDEAVQVALGESAESYPQILVNVAKLAFKKPALSLRLIGVVESKSALKSRIARMLSRPIPKKAKLGLIGLISVFIVAAVLLPMAAARNEENATEPDESKFEATLSNGVTVELIGTCQYTQDGVNCYRPDGLPLGRELKIAKWNQRPEAGNIGFMFKVDGPEDVSLWYHGIEGAKSTEGSCDIIDENGQKIEGWEAILTKLDDDRMTTTAKFGAAAGAWKTVAEHDGRSIKIVNGVSFTKAVETEQGVQIFTTDTIGRNVTQRIVAIDNNGKLHPWKGYTGSVSNSQMRQSVGTFPNLKLDQIEKFRFQTRPYEWVEFKNVSVKPNFKTDVQIEVKTPGNSIKDRIGAVTFKEGTSVRDALRFIASTYKKNIIISDKVSGQVPITELYDVTFEELLEAVLGTHKYIVDGGFIRVYTAEEFESLYPNLKTDVKIESVRESQKTTETTDIQQLSFGPVVEMEIPLPVDDDDIEYVTEVNCFIDFETQSLYSFPKEITKKPDFEDLLEEYVYTWCKENGIDTVALQDRNEVFFALELQKPLGRFFDVGNEYWNLMTPELLKKMLEDVKLEDEIHFFKECPDTLAFKTTEGNVGLMQVTSFAKDFINISYKMVYPLKSKVTPEAGKPAGRYEKESLGVPTDSLNGDMKEYPVLLTWPVIEGAEKYIINIRGIRGSRPAKSFESVTTSFTLDETNTVPSRYQWSVSAYNKQGEFISEIETIAPDKVFAIQDYEPVSLNGKKVLVDLNHTAGLIDGWGYYNHSQYMIKHLLEDAGFEVEVNTRDLLTFAKLKSFDLLIFNYYWTGWPAFRPFVKSELTVIHQYVEQGGSLLVVGCDRKDIGGEMVQVGNQLVSEFGLFFSLDKISQKPGLATTVPGQKIINISKGIPMQLPVAIDGEGGTALLTFDGIPIVKSKRIGKGHVIVAGIGMSFLDCYLGDYESREQLHAILFFDFIEFLTGIDWKEHCSKEVIDAITSTVEKNPGELERNVGSGSVQTSAEQDEDNTGVIVGRVLDGENNPVADAIVLICDQQTGIPLAEGDYLPFTNGYLQGQQKKPTFATTDSSGNFSFENLPQGKYRLIAQSWPGVKEVGDIFEVKSQMVNLNGTVENINVTAGKAEQVVIKPLGTGSLMINQDAPNDETFTVLSTSPTRADPILGFAGWTGDFLTNMVGGNRMPEGRTIVNGLPEGRVYIAMFAADSVPGWTEAQADIEANRTTGLPYVPFVNSWSNSRHDPPESLVPIFNEIKSLTSTQQKELLMNSYKAVGLEPSENGGIWGFMAKIVDHLEKPVELPSDRNATFGEVTAAAYYIQLQKVVESKSKRIAQQNEQNRQVQNSTQQSSQTETENNLQQLIDSARAGQTVTVPKGTFTQPIVINKSLILKGEDANDCIIGVTDDEPAIFIDTKGKGVVTIQNLKIKWQLATSGRDIEYPFAVAVKDSKAQFKNCNFVPLGNYQRSPVALRAQGFTNMNVNNCRFEGYNYTIQFGEGTEGIIQDSIVTNSGHQGVSLYSGANVKITGNIIAGSKYHGIRSTGGKLNASDNLIINNDNRGIYLGNKSASGAITNNIIIGNGTNISGFARSQVSITNNILAGSSYAGVSMRDSCRLLIANNIFLKNGRGIILHEEAGKNTNRISKNTFWKNAVNFENIEQFAPPIETEPDFVDPNNGDFSLKIGPVREQNQGLRKPEVFKALWEKFKKLEVADSAS